MQKLLFRCLGLIIWLNLLTVDLKAQTKLSFSIKTHPVQWFYGFRPNINLELRLNERYALTTDIMWKTKIWRYSGGEPFQRLQKGKGYRISLGGRYYFGAKRNWFIELQMRYDHRRADFTLDTKKGFAFLIGKQFHFKGNLGMDQYLGLNLYNWKNYHKDKLELSSIFYSPLWGGLLNYHFEK